jgi:iduronate 2-sulfatase
MSPVSQVDLFPTLAELCGVETPANVQGQSLVPMLRDTAAVGRGWALTQVTRGGEGERGFFGYSLRTPRWRYTEWDAGQRGRELYDHEADPHELTNLANDPAQTGVITELTEQLHEAVAATYPPSGEIPPLRPELWMPNLTDP